MQLAVSHHHECKLYKEGDWLIYYCVDCKNYVKRFNIQTGEVKSTHENVKNKVVS